MGKNSIYLINLQNPKKVLNRDYFNLFLLMFCSIVGVGFVSGAEIYENFARFGDWCFLGLSIFFVLVFVICDKILVKISILDNDNISKSLLNKKWKIKDIIYKITMFLNVLIVSTAMFSGLKTFIKSLYYNNYHNVYIGLIFCIFILLFFGIKWLNKIDYLVVIFIVFMLMNLILSKNLTHDSDFLLIQIYPKKVILVIIYPILYVFMNLFQIEPLIVSSKIKLKTKRECFYFSGIFAGVLTIILIVFTLFLKNNLIYSKFSMPFLEYFKSNSDAIKYIFCLGLILALLSTLVSSLIGIKQIFLDKFKINNFFATVLAFILSFVIGIIPFDFFVKFIYPAIGVVNLIIFVFCS